MGKLLNMRDMISIIYNRMKYKCKNLLESNFLLMVFKGRGLDHYIYILAVIIGQ
jgi:hypothetical protein